MPNPESNVGRVRKYLSTLQQIMDEPFCVLTVDEIAEAIGLESEQVLTAIQNNGILRSNKGSYVLRKDDIVRYEGDARGPHELFEPRLPDDMTGVHESRNFTEIDRDPTG